MSRSDAVVSRRFNIWTPLAAEPRNLNGLEKARRLVLAFSLRKGNDLHWKWLQWWSSPRQMLMNGTRTQTSITISLQDQKPKLVDMWTLQKHLLVNINPKVVCCDETSDRLRFELFVSLPKSKKHAERSVEWKIEISSTKQCESKGLLRLIAKIDGFVFYNRMGE